jgi:hypothetical protein
MDPMDDGVDDGASSATQHLPPAPKRRRVVDEGSDEASSDDEEPVADRRAGRQRAAARASTAAATAQADPSATSNAAESRDRQRLQNEGLRKQDDLVRAKAAEYLSKWPSFADQIQQADALFRRPYIVDYTADTENSEYPEDRFKARTAELLQVREVMKK